MQLAPSYRSWHLWHRTDYEGCILGGFNDDHHATGPKCPCTRWGSLACTALRVFPGNGSTGHFLRPHLAPDVRPRDGSTLASENEAPALTRASVAFAPPGRLTSSHCKVRDRNYIVQTRPSKVRSKSAPLPLC